MMSILICAATTIELRASKTNVPGYVYLKTGMGLENAERSLNKYLASHEKPALIVSTGFAGAASDGIAIGDWVTCMNIAGSNAIAFDKAKICDWVSVSAISNAVETRKSASPIAVDMESEALARISKLNQIPFMVLRLISDTPDDPLPEFVKSFVAGKPVQGMSQLVTNLPELKRLLLQQSRNTLALRAMWRDCGNLTHLL